MKTFKSIKNGLAFGDLFSTTFYVRYNGDNDYQTVTGGICSVIVVGIAGFILVQMLLQTFTYSTITATTVFTELPPDQPIAISLQSFMFSVLLANSNKTSGLRYFDVSLKETQYNAENNENRTERSIAMIPCTSAMWPIPAAYFNALQLGTNLCPNPQDNITLIGSITATVTGTISFLALQVGECTSIAGMPACESPSNTRAFLDTQKIMMSIYYINVMISPGDQSYISYSIDVNNKIQLSYDLSCQFQVTAQPIEVVTDQSFYPWTSYSYTQLLLIPPQIKTYIRDRNQGSPQFVYYGMYKSDTKITYDRSFMKVSDVISYVGGLLGGLFTALIFLSNYSRVALEIQLGRKVYYLENDEIRHEFKKFNLFRYFGFQLYNFWLWAGCKRTNDTFEVYRRCREEVKKQLDIKLIMNRMIFYDRGLKIMLDDHHYKALHLLEPPSLQQSQKLRQFYHLRTKIKKHCATEEKRQARELREEKRRVEGLGQDEIPDSSKNIVSSVQMRTSSQVETAEEREQDLEEEEEGSQLENSDEYRTLLRVLHYQNKLSSSTLSKKIYKKLDNQILQFVSGQEEKPDISYEISLSEEIKSGEQDEIDKQ